MKEDTFDIRAEQAPTSTEKDFENALRPLSFDDFSGQMKVVDNLRIFVETAKYRGEPLNTTPCSTVHRDWVNDPIQHYCQRIGRWF